MSNNNHQSNITNPSVTTPLNWQDYLFYLSLNGLHQTQYFQQNFQIGTDSIELFNQYCGFEHLNLDYSLNLNP